MKYLLTMMMLIVIIGCEANTAVNNNETSITTEPGTNINAVSEKNEMEWVTYQNSRFGYSITYPADWTAGEESDNGDGKELYVGNPDVDIRAYASQHFEGIEILVSESMRYQSLKLDSGIRADMLVGYEDGMLYLRYPGCLMTILSTTIMLKFLKTSLKKMKRHYFVSPKA
ncbi:hypothetical protein ACFVQB_10805 [Paenibacillus sp. NPDC057886]|uniref:hypothetical protein n=1 Tax=Paenibacillus sp. NPDC057886 TaxID=3346270 RepID=UPI0036C93A8F